MVGSDVSVLDLSGQIIGITDGGALRQAIEQVLEGGSRAVVIDLGKVSFMTTFGMGVLIAGLKMLREQGGDMKLARPNARIRSILMVTDLIRIFDTYPSVEEACAAFG